MVEEVRGRPGSLDQQMTELVVQARSLQRRKVGICIAAHAADAGFVGAMAAMARDINAGASLGAAAGAEGGAIAGTVAEPGGGTVAGAAGGAGAGAFIGGTVGGLIGGAGLAYAGVTVAIGCFAAGGGY